MLIDTHAHLYWDSFKTDLNQVIQNSLDAGVSTIVNIGVDIKKSQEALDQNKNTSWPKELSVYSTIGIHPHEAIKYSSEADIQEDIEKLEKIYLSDTTGVVAIGECGLDYFFDPSFVEASEDKSLPIPQIKILQRKLFRAQIDLAKKFSLPVVAHIRDDRSVDKNHIEAWDEIFELTDNYPTILHCYSGLLSTTKKAMQKAHILVSFAANITYPKNEYLREAAKLLPLNKIILETDSPFLAPQSKRGQRNEPSSVKEIARLIADLKRIPLEEVAEQTTENAKKIFKISK